MIRLADATLMTPEGSGPRAVLDRVSFDFSPGIWHVAADRPGDARRLIHFLAGFHDPVAGAIRCRGARSWPLSQAASFGATLTGFDIVDTLCSLYALERRATLRLFLDLLADPGWLAVRFDRWPQSLQRQFGHIAFVAPVFDVYLLDVSPVLPDGDFYRRWRALFRQRIAGKIAIIASEEHRAALRDFPGTKIVLAGGNLRRVEIASAPLSGVMAAE